MHMHLQQNASLSHLHPVLRTVIISVHGLPLASTRVHKEQHLLHTTLHQGKRLHLLQGANDVAVLYAAYHFAELHGVSYGLHGDTIPSTRPWHGVQTLHSSETPIFDLRGLHPFHDFAEGPDW